MTERHKLGAIVALASLGLAGCPPDQTQDIPNRVLDRPTDVALACVHIECDEQDECHAEAASLRECRGETGSCTSSGNHLVGFVANSERNEIAVFTQCGGELVDMDIEAPGYNFVPVGTLPSAMTQSVDGCRAISANAGSCDLSVLDAPNLGAFGLDIRTPTRQGEDGARVPVEPSSLVANVVPLRLDEEDGWVPLGARPADILGVPRQISTAGGDIAPGDPILDLCGPDQPGSVYVSFPSCNMIGEIDLVTHRLLQSFQFELSEDGVDVIDTGVSPICPVDCPEVFSDGVPPDLPPAQQDGLAPATMELVHPPFAAEGKCETDDDPCTGAADCEVRDSALFVGGLGSDIVVEIPISDVGLWDDAIRQIELTGAAGIERLRVTPAMDDGPQIDSEFGDIHQFIYVIAGDGSTRVVRRELDPDRLDVGVECDTQADPPFAQTNPVCFPVTQTPVGVQPPDRRAFASGPGIRAPRGARVTDWAFKKVPDDTVGCIDTAPDSTPFGGPGKVVGIGTTNSGRIVYSTMGQFDSVQGLGDELDPVGLMDVGIRWHMLFPEFPPIIGETVDPLPLPTVSDDPPQRGLPEASGPTRRLAPGLRRIDWAYFYDQEVVGNDTERLTLGAAFGDTENPDGSTTIQNVDRMGGAAALEEQDAIGIYQESVVRALARDYRAWGGSQWELIWEGDIPGAISSTGQIKCDEPGWENATCRATQAGSSRIVDLGADFCSAGVLAGDKVVIVGCSEDNDCGAGQKCLSRPGTVPGSGICVSEQAFDQDEQRLRQVCDHYISDSCGEPRREFLITRAFQNELWLQGMEIPPISYLSIDPDGQEICVDEDGDADDDEQLCFPPLVELEDQFVCTEIQPEGGCSRDEECRDALEGTDEDDGSEFLCIEEKCRRVCQDADDCLLRRLPGTECFREFVRYQVRARNAFIVRGQGPATFLSDQVFSDPDSLSPNTDAPECVRSGPEAGVSTLLTSRIPLGATEDDIDLPLCGPSNNVPDSGSANPCLITQSRSNDQKSRFHEFSYYSDQADGGPVTAIRYSNPIMTIVIDLVDLYSLGTAIPEYDHEIGQSIPEGSLWPTQFRQFRRSRIPRGYVFQFNSTPGYSPIDALVGIGANLLTFPLRIVSAPDLNWTFIVDASGPGTSTAIRGQVLRVDVASNPPLADINFDGVR